MKEELKNIKEMLLDAPIEVKKAFNQVVEYFAKGKMSKRLPNPEYERLEDEYYKLGLEIKKFMKRGGKGGLEYVRLVTKFNEIADKLDKMRSE